MTSKMSYLRFFPRGKRVRKSVIIIFAINRKNGTCGKRRISVVIIMVIIGTAFLRND